MKPILGLAVLVLFFGCEHSEQSSNGLALSPPASGLILHLEAARGKNSFPCGAPVDLLLSLCNVGLQPIDVHPFLWAVGTQVQIVVKDSEGEKLLFEHPPHNDAYGGLRSVLLPKACLTEVIHLDQHYFLDLDRYTVEVGYCLETYCWEMDKPIASASIQLEIDPIRGNQRHCSGFQKNKKFK